MAFAGMVSNRHEQIALWVICTQATLGDRIFDHAELVQATVRIAAGIADQIDVVAIGGDAEALAPLGAIVPAQLVVESLALALGLDPDNPRGLAKVTTTDPDSAVSDNRRTR